MEESLRGAEEEKLRLEMELASSLSMCNRLQIELNSTMKQLEEAETARDKFSILLFYLFCLLIGWSNHLQRISVSRIISLVS